MSRPIRLATLVTIATFFIVPAAFGQTTSPAKPGPSQVDFDACNKQAEAQAGSPLARPPGPIPDR